MAVSLHRSPGGAALEPHRPLHRPTKCVVVTQRAQVGRNLLIRFSDDEIDQSPRLAKLLKRRFTDDETGIGGRLDFRTLEGTHVTPNAPDIGAYFEGFDWGLAQQWGVTDQATALFETAQRGERERMGACALIVEFAEREVTRYRS